MSSPTITVTPEHFAAASRVFGHAVADVLAEQVGRALTAALATSDSMAGSDPAGLSWANGYDAAAAAAVDAGQDLINACWRFAGLLEQTGFNYAGAEYASNPHVAWSAPDTSQYGFHEIVIGTPPSAAGGSSPPPFGWQLIQHVIDAVWPNGHQDRLRAAAAAWSASARALEDAAWQTLAADRCITAEATPESPAAITASRTMQEHIKQVAAGHRTLATACADYAHHLDVVHSQVIDELWDLLEWTAAIEASGAVLSVVTLGLAEEPTQALEGWRIAKSAARVAELIQRMSTVAEAARATMSATRTELVAVRLRLGVVLDSRIVAAELKTSRVGMELRREIAGEAAVIRAMSGSARELLPRFTAETAQLERKFKHAAALGVLTKRGAAGFRDFRAALEAFVSSPGTVRLVGLFQKEPSVLSIDPVSGVCVVQHLDGRFHTAMELEPEQYMHVITKGSLGGQ